MMSNSKEERLEKLAKIVLIDGHCCECTQAIQITIGQYTYDRKLFWYTSYTCPYCGAQVEVDNDGIPPKEIREAILATEGQQSLIIQETGSRAVVAIKTLRVALGLPLNEAMKLKKTIPGVTISGTRVEMERLRQLLLSEGLNVWLEQS